MGKKKDKKGRKWSEEECRIKYVQSEEKIGNRTLAKMANRHLSTMGTWCSRGDWTGQRERYWNAIRTKTETKLIEKTSEQASDKLTELNLEHLALFKTIREVSATAIRVLAQEAIGDKSTSPEARAKKFQNNTMSLAFKRYANNAVAAATMERAIAGAKYADLNVAIEVTEKAGYIVSVDSETVLSD